MDPGSHKSGYLHHVFGDLQYALGNPFTCGDRQMMGSTSAPIQRAGRLGGHSHMASRSVRWLAGSKAWRGLRGADHDDYRTDHLRRLCEPLLYARLDRRYVSL
jgi:hypothetical protein